MYEVPRVALVRAVTEGKQIAAEMLQLHLQVAALFISEDVAVEKYQRLLRRVEAVRGLAEKAQAAMMELAPAPFQPYPEPMTLGLAELRTLAAELRARAAERRKIQTEMVRVNTELIMPAAEAWYAKSVGELGAVDVQSGGNQCLSTKRIVTLGPSGQGVAAAGVEMPLME